MKYIMVTKWSRHWVNLRDNSTLFWIQMFREGMTTEKLRDNTETIFIKKNNETKKNEKAWAGTVSCFKNDKYKDKEAIRFKVNIKEEISIPDRYKNYSEGWYVEEKEEIEETSFDPQFYQKLISTSDWGEFEQYTYYLIRCLGLHTTHAFHKREQKGRADGFFKLGNLAVLYDCTLDKDFKKSKSAQLENYCQQLKKGTIEYDNKRIDIQNCKKSVWVVMQKGDRKLLKEIDIIQIKVVPINALIRLYRKKIHEDIDEHEFERELENI